MNYSNLIVPEKHKVEKFGRESIKINNKHIESCLRWLTKRDLRILRLLHQYPYLTTSQIELFVFRNLKPSSWRNKANERLRKLYQNHLVDRWFPPPQTGCGTIESHYILDIGGAKILNLKGVPEMEQFRKLDYIKQNYKHSLKLYDFRAMLSLLTSQEDFKVKEWKLEHESTMRFIKKDEVVPDAFCQFVHNGRLKAFFLECDNGTMSTLQLKDKIRRYTMLYDSGEWKQTEWAKELKAFPPVLVIMHTDEDVKELNEHTSKLKSNIRFLYCKYDDLIDKDVIVYESARGKRREVPQSVRVRLLEPIWIHKNGRIML